MAGKNCTSPRCYDIGRIQVVCKQHKPIQARRLFNQVSSQAFCTPMQAAVPLRLHAICVTCSLWAVFRGAMPALMQSDGAVSGQLQTFGTSSSPCSSAPPLHCYFYTAVATLLFLISVSAAIGTLQLLLFYSYCFCHASILLLLTAIAVLLLLCCYCYTATAFATQLLLLLDCCCYASVAALLLLLLLTSVPLPLQHYSTTATATA